MKKTFRVILTLWISPTIFANPLPIYPAEIIARDLGHVGVTTAPNLWQDAFQAIEL